MDFMPEENRRQFHREFVEFCVTTARVGIGEETATSIRELLETETFISQLIKAIENAKANFIEKYMPIDEDLVQDILNDKSFWAKTSVKNATQTVIKNPSAFTGGDAPNFDFSDVLAARVNRTRVNNAVIFLMRCLTEAIWNLNAVKSIYQLRNHPTPKTGIPTQNIVESTPEIAAHQVKTSRVKHNLPNPIKVIGRLEEIKDICELLRPYPFSQYHQITIDGIGGVGKSVLALGVAYLYIDDNSEISASERFDGIIWTSAKRDILNPSGIVSQEQSLRNLGDIYSEIARTLERPDILSAAPEHQDGLVRNVLSHSRVLLIVDNLETIDDPKVIEFLRRLPAPTKSIITTRHRIDGALPIRISGMQGNDVLELIEHECATKRVSLSLEERKKLAEYTTGVPLAIVWTIGQVSFGHSIEVALRKLSSRSLDYAEFAFNESITFLKNKHKLSALRLLMGLALFADGATREAVGYVCGLQNVSQRDEGLSDLMQMSLINFDDGRFSMLMLTRIYSNALLAQDEEFREEALNLWFDWHVNLSKKGTGGQVDLNAGLLELFQTENTNILWAIETAFRNKRFDVYVKILKGMSFYWLGAGLWNDYERNFDLARLISPEQIDKVYFALRLTWLLILRQSYKKAQEVLDYAVNILKENPHDYEEMRAEDYSGQLAMELNETDKAEKHLNLFLSLAIKISDRRGQFAAYKYLGELYCRTRQPDRAREMLKKAEPFASGTEEDQWIRGLAHSYHLRGLIDIEDKKWEDAIRSFHVCIDYLKIWPDQRLLTRANLGIAFANFQLNHLEEARALLLQNIEIFHTLGVEAQNIKPETIVTLWLNQTEPSFWQERLY